MSGARRARPREEADDAHAFDVIDALGGLARLVKRTPTLDGAVPVRVAQACVPLLEGNAFGLQIELTRALHVRRRLGRVAIEIEGDEVRRAHRAAIPRLAAEGLLAPRGAWHRALAERTAWFERPHVRVWTGLFVRARRGAWLRVSSAANRRNRLLAVREAWIADDDRWVPLVVDLIVRGDARIVGEIACIAPFAPGARFDVVDLADAPELGRAHAAFYDEAYFASKKREPTRKYRRLVAREKDDAIRGAREKDDAQDAAITVARVGPSRFDVERAAALLRADATTPGEARAPAIESLVYRNDVAFSFTWDGHTLAIDHDANALAAGARDVEARWARAYGAGAVERDRRALWYLTKYFTPHPPGEPHFFLKPWTFTKSPPGWSCLLEGVQHDAYDVMRGVVSTDSFHATPAVFWVHRVGERVRVPAGEVLLRVLPVPRRLLNAGAREVPWAIEWRAS